ncbi:glycosyltransferase 87 family protein [Nocardioides sp.]|uniref:glycosyltransferase 87 family protein n=1 Tax=Nocardioides sp. TaxID=35761 RepID=UPI002BCED739|nr:glycosyltransferase 87 family protein [Nocardioides sp.]HXH81031.1 glycosyltransferase 87 family protein [Nocardioides sp.]
MTPHGQPPSGALESRVAPSREDPVVRSVSEVVGGPLGDHAGGHPWWTPLRVVLLLASVAMSLGILAKAPCLDTAGGSGTGRYTALCWTDTSTAYVQHGYAEGYWPFTDDEQVRARYAPGWVPPLPAYVAFVSQRITAVVSGSPDLDERAQLPVSEVVTRPEVLREARIFTLVNAVLLAAAALLAAGLLTRLRRRRPWDAAAFAAAPMLVLFFPITWDLLAAAAVAGALWAWTHHRPAATGLAIGVGAAASPFVALLLVPALALHLRHRRPREAGILAAIAVASWSALMAPALLSSTQAWRTSWRGFFHGADVGSSWLLVSQVVGWSPSTTVMTVVTAAGLSLVGAAVVWLAWRTRWSFASLGTLLIASALILSPASAPSYALVLLPLAVAAVRSWSHLLIWQGCEIVHWALLGFYLGGALAPAGGGEARAYWWAMAMRIGGLVWLVVATRRHAGGPDSADVDPVEGGRGEPDPDLDVLTHAGHSRA